MSELSHKVLERPKITVVEGQRSAGYRNVRESGEIIKKVAEDSKRVFERKSLRKNSPLLQTPTPEKFPAFVLKMARIFSGLHYSGFAHGAICKETLLWKNDTEEASVFDEQGGRIFELEGWQAIEPDMATVQFIFRKETITKAKIQVAPEFLKENGKITFAVDVFQFALTTLELLSKTTNITLKNILDKIPADYHQELVRLLQRCLVTNPDERPTMVEIYRYTLNMIAQLEERRASTALIYAYKFFVENKSLPERQSGFKDQNISFELLKKAATACVERSEGLPPSLMLARRLLAQAIRNKNFDNQNSPMQYFIPGMEIQATSKEIAADIYKFKGIAMSCKLSNEDHQEYVLLGPSNIQNVEDLLQRCIDPNELGKPNDYVIGPARITSSVLTEESSIPILPIALLFHRSDAKTLSKKDFFKNHNKTLALLGIAQDLVRGLAYLHKRNIVHGNLSLEYAATDTVTHKTKIIIGEKNYKATAPESLKNQKFSRESDVFHFAVMILELITDETWFAEYFGSSDPEIRSKKLQDLMVNDCAIIRSKIPSWCGMSELLMKCLKQKPAERPTMDMIDLDLQILLKQQQHFPPTRVPIMVRSSHIYEELSIEPEHMRRGGIFGHLFGEEMRQAYSRHFNAKTMRLTMGVGPQKTGFFAETLDEAEDASGLHPDKDKTESLIDLILKKVAAYKERHFNEKLLTNPNGMPALSRGIYHFPTQEVTGTILLPDKNLIKFIKDDLNRLENDPPRHPDPAKDPSQKEKSLIRNSCEGDPRGLKPCHCEREARPPQPRLLTHIWADHAEKDDKGIVIKKRNIPIKNIVEGVAADSIPQELLKSIMDFLAPKDFAALARTCWNTAIVSRSHIGFCRNLIKQHAPANHEICYFPLEGHGLAKVYSDAMRRWAKIIALQQTYIRAHNKLTIETNGILGLTDIDDTERRRLIQASVEVFKAKQQDCALCEKEIAEVSYGRFYSNPRSKRTGGAFMSCETCYNHKQWNVNEAKQLWCFTPKQLEGIPHWKLGDDKRFCTADLQDFRMFLPMKIDVGKGLPDLEITEEMSHPISPEILSRVADLPKIVHDIIAVEQEVSGESSTEFSPEIAKNPAMLTAYRVYHRPYGGQKMPEIPKGKDMPSKIAQSSNNKLV